MAEEKKTEIIERPVAAPTNKKPFSLGGVIAIAAVVAVLTGFIGFASGVQYQKVAGNNSSSNQPAGLNGQQGFGGRGGMNFNGTFGKVTAISDTSITITETAGPRGNSSGTSGGSKTYAINDTTKITVDSETGSASDIKSGDIVIIAASSSDSSVASSIRVGMGGFGGPGQQQSSDSSSSDTTTRTN